VTAILFNAFSLDRSSAPLVHRNLVWSYRFTSCCDILPKEQISAQTWEVVVAVERGMTVSFHLFIAKLSRICWRVCRELKYNTKYSDQCPAIWFDTAMDPEISRKMLPADPCKLHFRPSVAVSWHISRIESAIMPSLLQNLMHLNLLDRFEMACGMWDLCLH